MSRAPDAPPPIRLDPEPADGGGTPGPSSRSVAVAMAAAAAVVVLVVAAVRPATTTDPPPPPALGLDEAGPSAFTAFFLNAEGVVPHDTDPVRMAWIEDYEGERSLLTGTPLAISPPDSPVEVVAAVREGERLVDWGSWGFRLAAPAGDGYVVRLLDPTGKPVAERTVTP